MNRSKAAPRAVPSVLPAATSTPAPAQRPAPTAPKDRYRVIRRLAAGGMAEVFLAESESIAGFRKRVALKRILPHLTQDRRFRAMFLDEARLSLALQHSRIVQVFDIGLADSTYFIVMEFVDGVDLKTILAWRARLGCPTPLRLALHIAVEICSALDYAHELCHPDSGQPLGIVHRDVTPTNILLSKQGEVKVLDFGVAKATNQAAVTDPGLIKGKFGYLAPETANGHPIDQRADVFAVGILLFELIAGRRLFRGETDFETVKLVRAARVPDLRGEILEVDDELMFLLSTALAARPEDRFQTAADLADAIASYGYSHDLKVTAQDLGSFVQGCLHDFEQWTNPKLDSCVVEELIIDELERFQSILCDPSDLEPPELGSSHSLVSPAPDQASVSEPARDPACVPACAPAREPTREPTQEISLSELVPLQPLPSLDAGPEISGPDPPSAAADPALHPDVSLSSGAPLLGAPIGTPTLPRRPDATIDSLRAAGLAPPDRPTRWLTTLLGAAAAVATLAACLAALR